LGFGLSIGFGFWKDIIAHGPDKRGKKRRRFFTLFLFNLRGTKVLVKGFDADLIMELIERERLTLFLRIPNIFRTLLESTKFARTDCSSIRFLVSGGAPCRKSSSKCIRPGRASGCGKVLGGPNFPGSGTQ